MSNVIRLVRVGEAVRRVDEGIAAAPGAGARAPMGAVAAGFGSAGRTAPSSLGGAKKDNAAAIRPCIRAVPSGIVPPVGAATGAGAARVAPRARPGPAYALPVGGAGRHGGMAHARVVRPAGLADTEVLDASWVVARLEEAGRTLLALPGTGYSTKLRTSSLDIVRTAMEAYGDANGRVRPSIPSAAHITRMDEALGWIPMIPQDRYVLRRIVGARCLVSPMTDRPLYSWRKLGDLLGADHKAVQRWHAQGIALLVSLLGG